MSNGSSELIRYYQTCRAILKAAEPVENLLDDHIIHHRLTRLDNASAVRGEQLDAATVEAVREMDRQVAAIRSPRYRKQIRRSLNRINPGVFPDTNRAMPWYILDCLSAELLVIVAEYTVSEFGRLDGTLRDLKQGIGRLRKHVINLQEFVPDIRDGVLIAARNGTPVDAAVSPTRKQRAKDYLNANRDKRNTWANKITGKELASAIGVSEGTVSRWKSDGWEPWCEYLAELEKTKQPTGPKERRLTDATLATRPAETAEKPPSERLDDLIDEALDRTTTDKRRNELAAGFGKLLNQGDDLADRFRAIMDSDQRLQELIGEIDPTVWSAAEIGETG